MTRASLASDTPKWVKELARQYYAGRTAVFILYGNVHDLVWYDKKAYPARDFYMSVLFRRRELVLAYNPAIGLLYRDSATKDDFTRFCAPKAPPDPTPSELFPVVHNYFLRRLAEGRRLAFIIEHTELIIPNSNLSWTAHSTSERKALLYFLQWAQSPEFLRGDITILLLTESLSELHQKLVSNPHMSAIRIPYPEAETRQAFIQEHMKPPPSAPAPDPQKGLMFRLPPSFSSPLATNLPHITTEQLTVALGGLTLVQIDKLLAEVAKSDTPWTEGQLLERKKQLVEAHAAGLIEFMSTHLTLDAVAGHHAAKAYLRSIAAALKAGHTAVIPMGFLITGPVGTGKTFLMRCFAGEIGMPMVQLKNFRSKWHGETEANLEKILALLEALAPIAVFVDEADTQLGTRESSSDHGVSARVFGRLANFMSDPRHRGRILWFLATARPDLLPVDLKRQGRAEEHIPLFPPTTPEEKKEVVRALAQRLNMGTLKLPTSQKFWNDLPPFTGAEWEAILTRARFHAIAEGRSTPEWKDVQAVLADFIPPSYPEQMEYMTYLAVLECTRRSLLPPMYQQLSRTEVLERIAALGKRLR